eukprot:gnl/TRDRNA2_/TRDRNA2_185383_c0_seq1.p1 gnl/TRDRNA2_/TRDRNA2_185383_c0~~gnl/TRDRNA2_/TRDRNA2_185383_c0_seq1.p1  ORF type:complete len:195 (+),score=45.40 gnl/TRDRNA2_/TRDRNA2_185383_c0_seq1:110-694(+)
MGRKRHAIGEAGSETTVYQQAGDPLLTALFEGDVEGAVKLIKSNACSIEAADHMGWRPLHRAAFGGFEQVVSLLLERKADARAADHDGLQPLHVAASGAHVECCRMLLDAKADPTAPDGYSGMSAQMYALVHDGDVGKRLLEVLGEPDLGILDDECKPCGAADSSKAGERQVAAKLSTEVAEPEQDMKPQVEGS